VILFGDSLTEYSFSEEGAFAAVLGDKLMRKADVVARGFSGYNTRMSKALLPHLVASFGDVKSIAAFVIFLGANDANTGASMQKVPLEEYEANLKWMVTFLEVSEINGFRYHSRLLSRLQMPVCQKRQSWGRAIYLMDRGDVFETIYK
jgi:lysophospholipase L1-like esterase